MIRRGVPWLVLTALLGVGCSFPTGEFTLGPADTGTADTGNDLGAVDTGTPDTGTPDTGEGVDTGNDTGNDAGVIPDDVGQDTGPADTGEDTGTPLDVVMDDVQDGGALDAVDVVLPDTGPDTGPADLGVDIPDTGNIVFCATSRPCPTGLVCDDGICESRCPTGQQACGGFCRATQTDTANCGACGTACTGGQECRSGTCTTVCSAPTTNCSNVCRDLQADNNNCGSCGLVCAGGTSCSSGRCTCPSGQVACNGACTNTQTDVANCGSCNNRCAAGQLCANGACVTNCTGGTTNCSGVCRNLQTDVAACGACGRTCTAPTGGTATCTSGNCVLACPTGRTNCDGVCVDLNSNEANCGACNRACTTLLASCLSGLCCTRGTANCGGRCVTLSSDEANCGACGRACPSGTNCRSGQCEYNFRVASLGQSACRAIDQGTITGDDRGGIAANTSYVFYNTDTGTGRALSFDLTGYTNVSTTPVDGAFTNLRSGVSYAFSADGTTSYRYGTSVTSFTYLLELNATTLQPTGTRIQLTPAIAYDNAQSGRYGVFAGYDRVILYNGSRAYNVNLQVMSSTQGAVQGAVTDLGAVMVANPFPCENWAFWGVAEYYGDALWLVYRQYPTSGTTSSIVRVNVATGATSAIATFANLSDLCSFTISTARARWYWHHEGTSQFANFPSGEALGYCEATFAYTN